MVCFRCVMSHKDALLMKPSLSAGRVWLVTSRLDLP